MKLIGFFRDDDISVSKKQGSVVRRLQQFPRLNARCICPMMCAGGKCLDLIIRDAGSSWCLGALMRRVLYSASTCLHDFRPRRRRRGTRGIADRSPRKRLK